MIKKGVKGKKNAQPVWLERCALGVGFG